MKWFGEDGRLMALPDPVKEISCRPPFRDEEELPIITAFLRVSHARFTSLPSV